MLNQRASIFSVHSHSNSSLFNQKQLTKKRKPKIRNSSSIDYFEILNLKEIDQKIYRLLKQYLLKRKLIIICSFIIITLISLNTSFLVIHNYDCRIFNLCSIDTNDESRPFFVWIIIGLILTLITILIFILLHLFNIKQYYTQKLTNLTIIELRNRSFYSDDSTISLNSSLNSNHHHVTFSNFEINPNTDSKPKNRTLHKTLSNVSIKIDNFDDQHKSTLNCHENPNFKLEPDEINRSIIELSELSFSTKSSNSTINTKESSLSTN